MKYCIRNIFHILYKNIESLTKILYNVGEEEINLYLKKDY